MRSEPGAKRARESGRGKADEGKRRKAIEGQADKGGDKAVWPLYIIHEGDGTEGVHPRREQETARRRTRKEPPNRRGRFGRREWEKGRGASSTSRAKKGRTELERSRPTCATVSAAALKNLSSRSTPESIWRCQSAGRRTAAARRSLAALGACTPSNRPRTFSVRTPTARPVTCRHQLTCPRFCRGSTAAWRAGRPHRRRGPRPARGRRQPATAADRRLPGADGRRCHRGPLPGACSEPACAAGSAAHRPWRSHW